MHLARVVVVAYPTESKKPYFAREMSIDTRESFERGSILIYSRAYSTRRQVSLKFLARHTYIHQV